MKVQTIENEFFETKQRAWGRGNWQHHIKYRFSSWWCCSRKPVHAPMIVPSSRAGMVVDKQARRPVFFGSCTLCPFVNRRSFYLRVSVNKHNFTPASLSTAPVLTPPFSFQVWFQNARAKWRRTVLRQEKSGDSKDSLQSLHGDPGSGPGSAAGPGPGAGAGSALDSAAVGSALGYGDMYA